MPVYIKQRSMVVPSGTRRRRRRRRRRRVD